MNGHQTILILDFGSQYTQLIARRIREQKVYCEIVRFDSDLDKYSDSDIRGYVLSGGPASLADEDSPRLDSTFFKTSLPILGICYGMQFLAQQFGGELVRSDLREYGRAEFRVSGNGKLLKNVPAISTVWMSHGDSIVKMPEGFNVVGSTDTLDVAAVADEDRQIYGVQFHPEVHHTKAGQQVLRNFLFDICRLKGDWDAGSMIDDKIASLKKQIGDKRVLLGISGGVDSTVAALLLDKAIGGNLHAVFVDNGLLRKNEFNSVQDLLSSLNLNFYPIDASEGFLSRLAGVEDPEKKRKIIGNYFVDVFEEQADKIGGVEFLAQGTLYPDVIESVSFKGPSATIKSHHNVGGLKERMRLKLVEPLRELFKDEVREIGRALGLPHKFIGRHPFPGPGLAVRIIGEVTKERCDLLREVDNIFIEQLHHHKIYDDIWQAFSVLLPIKAVGVMGDERTYENVVSLRAVTSVDGMTADWARIDNDILAEISDAIIRNVKGVNRVVYDISSKPPATIEWE